MRPAACSSFLRRPVAWLGAALILAGLTGCATPPPVGAVALPPIPPGEARVWFYRIYDPSESLGTPYIYMNGAAIGVSEQGDAFYRDVPAGRYHVTVESVGVDLYQFQDIALLPGQQEYIEIQSLRSWVSGRPGFGRDTFYVAVIAPERAALQVARSRFSGGG
ncbi:MAG TPA: DUF2846 domain-containing protein [Stellaceae bacterium]|jgi:hypothetical protein